MTDYILCLMGILVYFINRYANKKQKDTKLSLSYWFKDNWPELTTTLLLNAAIMILVHLPGTTVDLTKLTDSLPFGLNVAGVPTLSFLLGLGLTAAFYRMFKSKTT